MTLKRNSNFKSFMQILLVNLQGHELVGVASHAVLSGRNEKVDLLCCAKYSEAVCFAKCCLLIITIQKRFIQKRKGKQKQKNKLFRVLFSASYISCSEDLRVD